MKLSIFLAFLGLVSLSWQDDEAPRVKTPLGSLKGYYKTSQYGRKYAAYEGVPYAQPPVGKLRFQPPEPVRKWVKELPATKKSSVCTQFLMNPNSEGDRVTGCEDCLYMNIYVPETNNSKLLPVMVWIHGGAYQYNSGNSVDEKFIMDRDVIFVTINYRLGPFGFLSTGNSIVPGNMGLKDQSMALRWVSEYIGKFSGNSQNVTIFGLSAGGASVHYHYLSPWSAGLFQRGISISGVALEPWPQTERAPQKAKKLGALMGCPTNDTSEMISCLKERPPRVISQAVGNFMYWLYNPFTPFGPVVEKGGDNPFIAKSPIEIIADGEAADISWITGVVSEEGLYPAAQFVDNDELLAQLDSEWDVISKYLLDFNDTIPLEEQAEVSEKIRAHYLGTDKINNETVTPLIHMVGDRLFAVDCEKAARLQAKANKSPVWTYYYSYRALKSVSDRLGGNGKNFGVCHGDDIALVLDPILQNTSRPEDIQMQEFLLDYYTSYAIEGRPYVGNVTWETLNPEDETYRYLHIASPQSVSMDSNDDFAELEFWNTIPFNENKLCR